MIVNHLLLLLPLVTSAIGFRGFDTSCYIQVDLESCWSSGATEVKIRIHDFGTTRKYPMDIYSTGVVCHPMKCIGGKSSSEVTIVATATFGQQEKVPTDPTHFHKNHPLYTSLEQCYTGLADVIVKCQSPVVGLNIFSDINDLLSLECESNEALYPVSKQFDNGMETPKWEFQCKTSMKLSQSFCKWSEKVNSWESNAFYQCPLNSVMTGVKTYYENENDQPHFQFKCCFTPNYSTTGCKLSKPNEFPAQEDMLVGVFVPAKDSRNEEDWQFLTCNHNTKQFWNELHQD